uniref:MAGE domain-containing protein n=1 Tax=Spermophilus dauricus TaxID=99837 RepID=A0A8C9Q6A3_SPEDA
MSSHSQKHQHHKDKGEPKAQREAPSLNGVQVLRPEVERASSACISSRSTPTLSKVPSPEPLICAQVPERSSALSVAMAPTPGIPFIHLSSSQEADGPFSWKNLKDRKSLLGDPLDEKMADLVQFLLLKYRMKELTTKAEMLSSIIKNNQDDFPVIFSVASECMHLVFGIHVEEVDPSNHSYVVINALGLTYDGMQGDDQSMPKTGLLVIILCIIFMVGDCACEQDVWEMLSVMEVYPEREHFIYGEPRKLITEDLVQERYLEYDPACYEFLWGPRARAETSKMKVLEYRTQVHGSDRPY